MQLSYLETCGNLFSLSPKMKYATGRSKTTSPLTVQPKSHETCFYFLGSNSENGYHITGRRARYPSSYRCPPQRQILCLPSCFSGICAKNKISQSQIYYHRLHNYCLCLVFQSPFKYSIHRDASINILSYFYVLPQRTLIQQTC